MVTCLCFLSLVFQVVQLELEDGLVDVLWWCLCVLDPPWSLEKLVWWGSALSGVLSVMVCAWTPVTWCTVACGSVIGSRVTSSWVTVTVTPVSVAAWMRSGPAKPMPVSMAMVMVPIMMVILRSGSIVSFCVRIVISVSCWYAWWQDFVWAICCGHCHSHCSQSIWYEGNSLPCVLILDIGNIYLHC